MAESALAAPLQPTAFALERPVVIVGNGPVGIRTAQEILRRDPGIPLVIYGDERWEPYHRIRLSGLLSGTMDWHAILNELKIPPEANVLQRFEDRVVGIDRSNRSVVDANGNIQPYCKLVLATGSRPHVPANVNLKLSGIYTLRALNDAERLLARLTRTRHTIVLGGGLLGLEAARGMARAGTEVTVIEHTDRLMPQQLDQAAAQLLREHLLRMRIRIVLRDGVKWLIGETSVIGVELFSGRHLKCDTVILATGIRPNIELARAANLAVGRGIRVDDSMRTSDPHIFAVGDCAEHRERVYGLLGPGLEQAAVAAHSFTGRRARYRGSSAAARLQVIGCHVVSAGRVGEEESPNFASQLIYERSSQGVYRKLLIHRRRLVGVIAIGQWPEVARIQEAVQSQRRIWPWQGARFLRTGSPWSSRSGIEIRKWPAHTVVCHCVGITKADILCAMKRGHVTPEQLAQDTGASQICGACRWALLELGASASEHRRLNPRIALVVAFLLVLLVAFGLMLGRTISEIRARPSSDPTIVTISSVQWERPACLPAWPKLRYHPFS